MNGNDRQSLEWFCVSGYSSQMKTAPVTDLKNRLSHYLRMVAKGDTVTVLDRGKPIAQITPIAKTESNLNKLAAEGLARLPLREAPKGFWTAPLPQSAAPVSVALDEDREDRAG